AEKGKLDEAIKALREAIRLEPKEAEAHYNLANVLSQKGLLDEAGDEFRLAVHFDPNLAEAHCNLGQLLRGQGQFADALKALRCGHELGLKKGPRWRYPSGEWIQECERLLELERQLPRILDKEIDPPAAERIEYAQVAVLKRRYAAAARLYREA